MLQKLKNLVVEEEGQGLTEYGLIVGLVAVFGATLTLAFGDAIQALFTRVAGKIGDLVK